MTKRKVDAATHTINLYRQCFGTDSGKKVLAHLLRYAGYWDVDKKTTEELAMLNFCSMILKNLGLFYSDESTEEFIRKLFEMKAI